MDKSIRTQNENPTNKTDTIIRICIVVATILLVVTVITIAILSRRLNSFPQK